MPITGVGLAREIPAAFVVPAARAVEAAGLNDLWLVEGRYYPGAMSMAGAALAVTDRINVGLGVVSAVTRNPAIIAMEIAALSGLAPGRVLAGIGHGGQPWMAEIGERRASPVSTLREVLDAVRALLRGDEVTTEGRAVTFRNVRLEQPPDPVPPVLAGVTGPKSLAVAGRHADGLVLAGRPGPAYITQVRQLVGPAGDFEIVALAATYLDQDRSRVRELVAPWIAQSVTGRAVTAQALPFFDELAARVDKRGADAVLDAPDEWWTEFGAIGTPEDAVAHVAALARAGVTRVVFNLRPAVDGWEHEVKLLGREVVPHVA